MRRTAVVSLAAALTLAVDAVRGWPRRGPHGQPRVSGDSNDGFPAKGRALSEDSGCGDCGATCTAYAYPTNCEELLELADGCASDCSSPCLWYISCEGFGSTCEGFESYGSCDVTDQLCDPEPVLDMFSGTGDADEICDSWLSAGYDCDTKWSEVCTDDFPCPFAVDSDGYSIYCSSNDIDIQATGCSQCSDVDDSPSYDGELPWEMVACEQRGLTEAECLAVGCCTYRDGACYPANFAFQPCYDYDHSYFDGCEDLDRNANGEQVYGRWDLTCADYTISNYVYFCGAYNDDDFTDTHMCCLCGGGTGRRVPPSPPAAPPAPPALPSPPSGPTVTVCYDCVATCPFLVFGFCMDGGEDAFTGCPLGHMCSECGPREVLLSEVVACPMPPPSPPEAPPYICEDSCGNAKNGYCEDGRPDCANKDNLDGFQITPTLSADGCPIWDDCAPGSDCSDCGELYIAPPPTSPPPHAPPFAPLPEHAGITTAPGLVATYPFARGGATFYYGSYSYAELVQQDHETSLISPRQALAAAIAVLLGCNGTVPCRVDVDRLPAPPAPPSPPPPPPSSPKPASPAGTGFIPGLSGGRRLSEQADPNGSAPVDLPSAPPPIKPSVAPPPTPPALPCLDLDSGATDVAGLEGCTYYDLLSIDCGAWDDDDFTATAMCCACGGGLVAVPPAPPAAPSDLLGCGAAAALDNHTCATCPYAFMASVPAAFFGLSDGAAVSACTACELGTTRQLTRDSAYDVKYPARVTCFGGEALRPASFGVRVVWLAPNISAGDAPDAQSRLVASLAAASKARDAALAAFEAKRAEETEAGGSDDWVAAALDSAGVPTDWLLLGGVPSFSKAEIVTSFLLPPSPPPSPPEQPPPVPPPTPPAPPAPPPGLCTDTCNSQGGAVGECNDGGSGDVSTSDVSCDFGTDCSDCGVRIFCVDCPDECKALAHADPAGACLESMWGDGLCDDACNVLACDHNDCTPTQIVAKCITDQDQSGVDLSTPPGGQTLGAESYVPVNMQLDLSPARLEIRSEINEMVLMQEVYFRLQWQDTRLLSSPCKQVLPEIISLTREEANSDIQRVEKAEDSGKFWFGTLEGHNFVPGYFAWVEESSFLLEDSGDWQENLPPNYTDYANASDVAAAAVRRRAEERHYLARAAVARGEAPASHAALREAKHRERMARRQWGATERWRRERVVKWREGERRRLQAAAEDAAATATATAAADGEAAAAAADVAADVALASYSAEIEYEMLQDFTYRKFPFDRHNITIEVSVAGADLYTCVDRDGLAIMGITDDTVAREKLLPATGTWELDGHYEEAVRLYHPIDALTGAPQYSTCIVEIRIRRNWDVFFVKQILMMILCTYSGLLALLLQPAELLGDRCAQLLFALLIIITALQLDLGLGSLSYLIWVDYFNLMQLVVLVVALGQTMVIHRLDFSKKTDLLVIIDQVSRVLMPVCLYPAFVIGMVLYGLGWDTAGWVVFIGGTTFTVAVAAVWVYKKYWRTINERRLAVQSAIRMPNDVDDQNLALVLRRLYAVHDLDGSGDVDLAEMRKLIKKLYPDLPRTAISKAMLEVNRFAGADEELDFDAFCDAFEAAKTVVDNYVKEHPHDVVVRGTDVSGDAPHVRLTKGLFRRRASSGDGAAASLDASHSGKERAPITFSTDNSPSARVQAAAQAALRNISPIKNPAESLATLQPSEATSSAAMSANSGDAGGEAGSSGVDDSISSAGRATVGPVLGPAPTADPVDAPPAPPPAPLAPPALPAYMAAQPVPTTPEWERVDVAGSEAPRRRRTSAPSTSAPTVGGAAGAAQQGASAAGPVERTLSSIAASFGVGASTRV